MFYISRSEVVRWLSYGYCWSTISLEVVFGKTCLSLYVTRVMEEGKGKVGYIGTRKIRVGNLQKILCKLQLHVPKRWQKLTRLLSQLRFKVSVGPCTTYGGQISPTPGRGRVKY